MPLDHYVIQQSDGKAFLLENYISDLGSCMSFMDLVLNGVGTCLEVEVNYFGREKIKLSPLGKYSDLLSNFSRNFTQRYEFHPAIAFFFEQYRGHEVNNYHYYKFDNFTQKLNHDGNKMVAIFDDFVLVMRRTALQTGLKKKIANWESKAKKNKSRACKLENSIFEKFEQVEVIRLNLDCAKAIFESNSVNKFYQEDVSRHKLEMAQYWGGIDITPLAPKDVFISFDEVQRNRMRLFANMKGKPSLFGQLIGYLWRIDSSPRSGYHLQVALFFDGNQVDQYENLAQQIGEYWVNNVTNGRGHFFNFNMYKDTNPAYRGLGSIPRLDIAKRDELRNKVLAELCREQNYVQVMPKFGSHMFGTGWLRRNRQRGDA